MSLHRVVGLTARVTLRNAVPSNSGAAFATVGYQNFSRLAHNSSPFTSSSSTLLRGGDGLDNNMHLTSRIGGVREFSSRVATARKSRKKNTNKIKWVKGMVHPRDLIQTWNIVQGDTVEVIRGEFEGTQAVVKKVMRKRNEVVLEGVNVKQVSLLRRTGEEVVVSRELGIHYSNVALVDPATKERTKVKYMWREDGTKVRVSKTTGNEIPKPVPFRRNRETNPRDTPPEVVQETTFQGR